MDFCLPVWLLGDALSFASRVLKIWIEPVAFKDQPTSTSIDQHPSTIGPKTSRKSTRKFRTGHGRAQPNKPSWPGARACFVSLGGCVLFVDHIRRLPWRHGGSPAIAGWSMVFLTGGSPFCGLETSIDSQWCSWLGMVRYSESAGTWSPPKIQPQLFIQVSHDYTPVPPCSSNWGQMIVEIWKISRWPWRTLGLPFETQELWWMGLYGGFHSHGGTPSSHPFLDGIFPKPSSYWGTPLTSWKPPYENEKPLDRCALF